MDHKRTYRLLSIMVSAALIAGMLFAAGPAREARAATFTVGTRAALQSAITTANGNGEADTITLTADILLDAGLPNITSVITIEGAGYTLNGNGARRAFNVGAAGNLTINNLTITNGNFSLGGAINSAGTLTINNSTLSGNHVSGNGGAIYHSGAGLPLTINNSTISNNTAGVRGGGLVVGSGSIAYIYNSTISNNSSYRQDDPSEGGGLRNAGTLTIENSTFTGNSTRSDTSSAIGGAIYNDIAGTLTLRRSIISGNTDTEVASSGDEIANYGTFTANSYNVLGHNGITDAAAYQGFAPGATDFNATSSSANATLLANILNTTLANNGGRTQTHALPAVSPAIDRAPSAACSAAPINGFDQRGVPRNYNGSGLSGECDSGAVEMHAVQTVGTCGSGALLTGVQAFDFGNHDVSIDVNSTTDLRCIRVEAFSPAVHPLGTTPIQATNRWWHISGDTATTYNVDITLIPSFAPDAGDQICRLNNVGLAWSCAADSVDTINNTITRNGVTQFSDWATSEDADPTAVSLSGFGARVELPWLAAALGAIVLALAVAGMFATVQAKRRRA